MSTVATESAPRLEPAFATIAAVIARMEAKRQAKADAARLEEKGREAA